MQAKTKIIPTEQKLLILILQGFILSKLVQYRETNCSIVESEQCKIIVTEVEKMKRTAGLTSFV